MEILSLLLKILTVLAALIGLAQLVAGFLKTELFNLSPRPLKAIGAALLLLAVLLGTAEYLTTKKRDAAAKSPSFTTGNLTAGGSISINQQVIEKLEISTGDTAAEKLQKQAQARRIVASALLGNIRSLDQRLAVLDVLKPSDSFGRELESIRDRVAPALRESAGEGYRKLMAEQQAASLQESFNSSPFRTDQSEAIIRLLHETNIDPAPAMRFYDQLERAGHASDKLVQAIRAPATNPAISSESLRKESNDIEAEQLRLAKEDVTNQSQLAFIYALMALNTPGAEGSGIDETFFPNLTRLTPRNLISEPEAQALIAEILAREQTRLQHAAELLTRYEKANQAALAAYAELDQRLRIEPTDQWDTVVAKAISLRQLGRSGEAVAAFARYAKMFGATDPGAELYAQVAQKFTIQLQNLGVSGGVYIYEIKPDSPLTGAGLKAGDIVFSYADMPVGDVMELTHVLSTVPFGNEVRIGFLHSEEPKGFTRHQVAIKHGNLSAGFMPI